MIRLLTALLLMSTAAQADTVVTITVTQTQIKTAPPPRASSGCDWTYPSSCYVPRPIIIERPKRK